MNKINETVLTVLVAEDEDRMRERLIEQLGICFPQAKIVAIAENGNDAWDMWLEHEPDVVFLDIQMPGMNGIAVAERIRGRSQIVFVTAYDQHAIAAFEHAAVDYLLKPVSIERLTQTTNRLLERARSFHPHKSTSLASQHNDVQLNNLNSMVNDQAIKKKIETKWIKASVGKQVRLIHLNDILFLQSDTKYTRVVTREMEAYIRSPLKDLVDMLDPEVFWQIHRGTIVNAHAIASAEKIDSERLEVCVKDCSEKLIVSRSFGYLFKET